MRRSNVFALLGGLILGIGIGGFVVWQLLNTVAVPATQAATPAVFAPPPPPAAPVKPAVRAKLRKSTGATKTADSRRIPPPIQYPAYSGTAPIGSGGTIFSGADSNDPRVQHFAD